MSGQKTIDEYDFENNLGNLFDNLDDLEEEINVVNWNKIIDEHFKGGYALDEPAVSIESKECIHDWKTYQGLIESYQYCTKCDSKNKNDV